MGSAFGVTSPVKVFAKTLYIEAHMQAGQRLVLPDAEERAVNVAKGKLVSGGADISEYAMAVFSRRDGSSLKRGKSRALP